MNENITPFTAANASASLENAATEFRSKVEDATTRLSGAAEQFVSMSENFASAIAEARRAADRAVAAQREVEELRDQLEHDYGVVSKLVADLQDRIAALSTLARPLPAAEPQTQEAEPASQLGALSIIPDRPDAGDRDTIVW